MRFQENVRERFFRHQSIATEIFSFMAGLGSPIRYIVFHPAGHGMPKLTTTINGSTWPNFCYKRGKVTADDGSKYEGFVALPISKAEFAEVEPFHDTIMGF